MKKIILLSVMFLPLVCNAQLMNQDPSSKFKYELGEIVYIPFNEVVGLCVLDSDDRVQDSILMRKELINHFDTTMVRAKIMLRFYVDKYEQAYYKINVFDIRGKEIETPSKQTDSETLRTQVAAERVLVKRQIIL